MVYPNLTFQFLVTFFPFRHYTRQTQGIHPTISQDFYLPLTAHSVAVPSLPTRLQMQGTVDQHLVKQEKEKKEAPTELSREDKSTWLPVSNKY